MICKCSLTKCDRKIHFKCTGNACFSYVAFYGFYLYSEVALYMLYMLMHIFYRRSSLLVCVPRYHEYLWWKLFRVKSANHSYLKGKYATKKYSIPVSNLFSSPSQLLCLCCMSNTCGYKSCLNNRSRFFFSMTAPVVSVQSKSSPCAVKISGKSLIDTIEDEQMLSLCWEV